MKRSVKSKTAKIFPLKFPYYALIDRQQVDRILGQRVPILEAYAYALGVTGALDKNRIHVDTFIKRMLALGRTWSEHLAKMQSSHRLSYNANPVTDKTLPTRLKSALIKANGCCCHIPLSIVTAYSRKGDGKNSHIRPCELDYCPLCRAEYYVRNVYPRLIANSTSDCLVTYESVLSINAPFSFEGYFAVCQEVKERLSPYRPVQVFTWTVSGSTSRIEIGYDSEKHVWKAIKTEILAADQPPKLTSGCYNPLANPRLESILVLERDKFPDAKYPELALAKLTGKFASYSMRHISSADFPYILRDLLSWRQDVRVKAIRFNNSSGTFRVGTAATSPSPRFYHSPFYRDIINNDRLAEERIESSEVRHPR